MIEEAMTHWGRGGGPRQKKKKIVLVAFYRQKAICYFIKYRSLIYFPIKEI